jgi:hypothetical protein
MRTVMTALAGMYYVCTTLQGIYRWPLNGLAVRPATR